MFIKHVLPVWTLSPTLNSAIVTDSPFNRVTLAEEGKQPPPPSPPEGAGVVGAGVGGGVVVGGGVGGGVVVVGVVVGGGAWVVGGVGGMLGYENVASESIQVQQYQSLVGWPF